MSNFLSEAAHSFFWCGGGGSNMDMETSKQTKTQSAAVHARCELWKGDCKCVWWGWVGGGGRRWYLSLLTRWKLPFKFRVLKFVQIMSTFAEAKYLMTESNPIVWNIDTFHYTIAFWSRKKWYMVWWNPSLGMYRSQMHHFYILPYLNLYDEGNIHFIWYFLFKNFHEYFSWKGKYQQCCFQHSFFLQCKSTKYTLYTLDSSFISCNSYTSPANICK